MIHDRPSTPRPSFWTVRATGTRGDRGLTKPSIGRRSAGHCGWCPGPAPRRRDARPLPRVTPRPAGGNDPLETAARRQGPTPRPQEAPHHLGRHPPRVPAQDSSNTEGFRPISLSPVYPVSFASWLRPSRLVASGSYLCPSDHLCLPLHVSLVADARDGESPGLVDGPVM